LPAIITLPSELRSFRAGLANFLVVHIRIPPFEDFAGLHSFGLFRMEKIVPLLCDGAGAAVVSQNTNWHPKMSPQRGRDFYTGLPLFSWRAALKALQAAVLCSPRLQTQGHAMCIWRPALPNRKLFGKFLHKLRLAKLKVFDHAFCVFRLVQGSKPIQTAACLTFRFMRAGILGEGSCSDSEGRGIVVCNSCSYRLKHRAPLSLQHGGRHLGGLSECLPCNR